MDKKYKLKFNNKINFTLLLVITICVIGIICDIVFLSMAIENQQSFVAYIVSMALLVVLLAFLILFKVGSFYIITNNHFIISISFIKKKIEFNDILNIRHDNISKQSILYYNTYPKNGDKLVAMLYLNVNEENLSNIVKELKEKNNMIIYDVFNEDKTNENNWRFNYCKQQQT